VHRPAKLVHGKRYEGNYQYKKKEIQLFLSLLRALRALRGEII